MNIAADTVLLIAACISFGLATFNVNVLNLNLIALGLLLWVLTFFVG